MHESLYRPLKTARVGQEEGLKFVSFLLLWRLFHLSKGRESKATSALAWKPSSTEVCNTDTRCVSPGLQGCVFSRAMTTLIKSDSAAETPIHSLPHFLDNQLRLSPSSFQAPPQHAFKHLSDGGLAPLVFIIPESNGFPCTCWSVPSCPFQSQSTSVLRWVQP